MVKLSIRRDDGEAFSWLVDVTKDPKIDYQSWADEYPTYQELILSVVERGK